MANATYRTFFILILLHLVILPAHAEDRFLQADAAVGEVLFEYEGSEEFASYVVDNTGHVEILFARNMPDDLYEEILTKLKNHPHIASVLAGRGGPACRMF